MEPSAPGQGGYEKPPLIAHQSGGYSDEGDETALLSDDDIIEEEDDVYFTAERKENIKDTKKHDDLFQYAYFEQKANILARAANSNPLNEIQPELRKGFPFDWNGEFQQLLELPEKTKEQRLSKYERISSLNRDFVSMAKRLGKIIISEADMPQQYRTINPVQVGGRAGGIKYIYNGILFKLQTDHHNIYGDPFLAMKTGGLELKGLMRYYGITGLHVPLMAVIDYRGYRLVAESILPINAQTIVYGSADGGKTLFSGDKFPQLKELMAHAAEELNLSGHFCGRLTAKTFMYGPIDIEVHLGTDQRFYVIDFARVYPPTAESDVERTFLYKVMRPEYVRRCALPLSSDAFSPFTKGMPDEQEQNLRVLSATDFLLNTVIPRFSEWLDQNYLTLNLEEPLSNLTELIHREGINCRYLGLVRQNIQSEYLGRLILNEMAARLLKNQLNRKLRKTMRRHATIAEHAFSEVVLKFFNRILGWDTRSQAFWAVGLRADLEDYFGMGIIDDIDEATTPLRSCFDLWLLLKRVQQLSGIKLTDQAMAELKKNPSSFFLVSPDIRKMAVRVKHMNIISLAEANALAIQAMDSLDSVLRSTHNARAFHHDRLFSLAMSKFEQAIRSTPDNTTMLNHYADVLERLALMKAGAGQECFVYFERAFERYNVARNWDGLMRLGETLCRLTPRWDEREKIPALANKCYMEVTQSESRRAEPFRRWGDVLVKSAAVTGNLKWISLAGAKYRKAIEIQPSDFSWLSPWHQTLSDEELATSIELLHANHQSVFKSDGCANPHLISDSLILQVASNLNKTLREVSLEGCESISDQAVIALANHCQNIEALNIRGCISITDKAIGNVADLPHLRRLDLSRCPILTSLSFKYIASKCVQLTHLNASFCDFQNSFISHLNNFGSSWLKSLDLSGLRILPEAWCRAINRMVLNQLEEIKLDGCSDLTDQCINVLAPRAPNLRIVSLVECTSLTDTAMFSLAQSCQKLEFLGIKQCVKLTSRSLTYFGSFFTSLRELHAQGCEKLLADLTQLQYFLQNTGASLRKLSFDGTPLDDEACSTISSYCSRLDAISFSFTRISSRAVATVVKSASPLQTVDLSDSRIDDVSVIALSTACSPFLRSLRLAGCHALTDAAAEALQLCSHLELLDISQCSLLTDQGVACIISSALKLKHLKLNECRKLTDATIELIGRHLHSLQTFHAERCMLFARIGPLGLGCPELREIKLRHCENIGDEGIESLGKLKLLRVLDVSGCRHVSDGLLGVLQTDAGCPALAELYLGGNKMIDSAVQHLQSVRPRLRVSGAMYNTPVSSSSESRRATLVSASSGELQPGSESPLSKSLKKSADSSPRISSAFFPTSSRSNQTAARALMHDLSYINKNPLPFASARPLGDNLLLWHGNLTAPENSPYAGAVFHIQLTFPETYPTHPPSGTMLTPLPHPHVHKDRICLDLLSDFRGYFAADGHKVNEGITGWSSAYSVQTILLQLQTFLMDLRPEDGGLPLHQYLSQIPEALRKANSFKCPHCEHSASSPWPSLGSPDDDINEVPKSEADIIRDELKCFHTRVPFEEDVLGIGISITFHKTNSRDLDQIHSPLDLLSYTAFKDDGVRESVYSDSNDKKMSFTHWLPLWINKQHGERAEHLLPSCLSLICTDEPNRFKPEMALTVLSKLMNGMIVDMMTHKMHASIKALEGYCAIHRLMIYFVRKYPALIEQAERTVSNFAKSAEHRTKNYVPSLGDFLALLSITQLQWRDLATAYIEENFIRNVRWVLAKYPELADPDVDLNRCAKTFLASQTSVRLMLFHVYFLEQIGRPQGKSLDEIADSYDKLFGRPNNAMKDAFLSAVRSIMKIKSWDEAFISIGVPAPQQADLCDWLQNSVRLSLKRGYHQATTPGMRRTPSLPAQKMSHPESHRSSQRSSSSNSHVNAPKTPSQSSTSGSASKTICKFWKESGGKQCQYGTRCRFLHVLDSQSGIARLDRRPK